MTNNAFCEAMEEKVTLLIYDELPADEVDEVRAHMDQCDACSTTFRELKYSASLIDESSVNLPALKLSDVERTHILVSILEGDELAEADASEDRPQPQTVARNTLLLWVIAILTLAVMGVIAYRLLPH